MTRRARVRPWTEDRKRQGSARGGAAGPGRGRFREGGLVPVAMPIQTDWVKSVLFDRGYLARIRGDAIKVYLVMLEASGGSPTGA